MDDNPLPPQPKPRVKMPRKPGDMAALKRRLWWGILHCEDLLGTVEEAGLRLKSLHALAQVSLAYLRVVEVSELDARLRRVENLMERNGHGRPTPAP